MPTHKKRLNMTVDDEIWNLLECYRDRHYAHRAFWRGPMPLTSVAYDILCSALLKECNSLAEDV